MDTQCTTCQDHLQRRRKALLPLFGRTMQRTGEPAHEIRARFLGGLHARHKYGQSLDPVDDAPNSAAVELLRNIFAKENHHA